MTIPICGLFSSLHKSKTSVGGILGISQISDSRLWKTCLTAKSKLVSFRSFVVTSFGVSEAREKGTPVRFRLRHEDNSGTVRPL